MSEFMGAAAIGNSLLQHTFTFIQRQL